jgi:hypothetical protein
MPSQKRQNVDKPTKIVDKRISLFLQIQQMSLAASKKFEQHFSCGKGRQGSGSYGCFVFS